MTIDELRASTGATITIRDASAVLGVNPRTLSSALSINGGDIRAVRCGRRVIIPRAAFIAWLDGTDERVEPQPAADTTPDAATVIRAKLIELLGELEKAS